MEDRMKLKIVIGFPNPRDQLAEPMQSPTIQLRQLLIRDSVLPRIEVVEITQQKATGIPNLSIGLDEVGSGFQEKSEDHHDNPAPRPTDAESPRPIV